MRLKIILCVAAVSVAAVVGCRPRTPEKQDDSPASRSRRTPKEDFSYDPTAPKEFLRVTRGEGEGATVGVYVAGNRIGTLFFGTRVQKIGERKGWYKIRFSANEGEFFGYIRMKEAEPMEATYRPPTPVDVGADTRPKQLTLQQSEDELHNILKVPFEYEVDPDDPEGRREKLFHSGKDPAGYGDLLLLAEFKYDGVLKVFVEGQISALRDLYTRCHPDYKPIVSLYGQALLFLAKGDKGSFRPKVQDAQRMRDRITAQFPR